MNYNAIARMRHELCSAIPYNYTKLQTCYSGHTVVIFCKILVYICYALDSYLLFTKMKRKKRKRKKIDVCVCACVRACVCVCVCVCFGVLATLITYSTLLLCYCF